MFEIGAVQENWINRRGEMGKYLDVNVSSFLYNIHIAGTSAKNVAKDGEKTCNKLYIINFKSLTILCDVEKLWHVEWDLTCNRSIIMNVGGIFFLFPSLFFLRRFHSNVSITSF